MHVVVSNDDDARNGGPSAHSCDRCPAPAAYTRAYSGQTLCMPCFRASIERKAAKTISKYGMIRDGDSVAVAVSGGKDSLALLHIMHGMAQRHNFEMRAITIDEGIPGYRDEALKIASGACRTLGVPHDVYAYKDLFGVTLDEALGMRQAQRKMSSCSICGTLRRRAVDIAAGDADAVATGHNLDDILQTFLINMLSGDTDKIAWMDPGGIGGGGDDDGGGKKSNRPRRIKPFCEIYESEIVYYAFASRLPFQEEPCPHMNEGIRTVIREFLNSLESDRSGIKNSMYASVLRMVRMARGEAVAAAAATITTPGHDPASYAAPRKQRRPCARCGADCTAGGGGGGVCSACRIITDLPGGGVVARTPANSKV